MVRYFATLKTSIKNNELMLRIRREYKYLWQFTMNMEVRVHTFRLSTKESEVMNSRSWKRRPIVCWHLRQNSGALQQMQCTSCVYTRWIYLLEIRVAPSEISPHWPLGSIVTPSKKYNFMRLERLARDMMSQWQAIVCEGVTSCSF